MNAQHTPGPWHSDCGCIYAACQMNERGTTNQRPLAEVTSDQDHDDHYVENCRLIAAAPELLQTLKHVEGALLDITCERESILKGVRAAIAKATGGGV